MTLVFGVRFILVIFYCIISKFEYQTVAFEIPGLQDLLEIAQVFPRNAVTHPPEEAPLTVALCNLKTDELIEYYGYIPEKHKVITEDGYILTVFRCNSNKTASQANKKAVIVQHGLLASSDDFCINDPSQGLAYVFADAGYDVWLPNARGNTYSRQHVKKDPNNAFTGFWKFSWYEHGIHDYPAVIKYVLEQTNNTKVYVVGHSQGTTGLMTLLSEKPEYNEYVAAASLLAPIAFLNNSDSFTHSVGDAVLLFKMFESTELLPKGDFNNAAGEFCLFDVVNFCGNFLDLLFGPSDHQRNDTILPSMMCHSPNGASVNQLLHYSQELKYGYFGKYMHDSHIPPDFELSRITVPISIHFSPVDRFTNPADIDRLIPLLNNSLVYTQTVHEFNHGDFVNGIHAASTVFSKILKLFEDYE